MSDNLEKEFDLFEKRKNSKLEQLNFHRNGKLTQAGFAATITVLAWLAGSFFIFFNGLFGFTPKNSACELISENKETKKFSCALISEVKIDKNTNTIVEIVNKGYPKGE